MRRNKKKISWMMRSKDKIIHKEFPSLKKNSKILKSQILKRLKIVRYQTYLSASEEIINNGIV